MHQNVALVVILAAAAAPARAGFSEGSGGESFTRGDVASVAQTLGGDVDKRMALFDQWARQTRENARRRAAPGAALAEDAPPTLSQLIGRAGGASANMAVPSVGQGAAQEDPKKAKLSKKEKELWQQCQETARNITRTPEITPWVAEYFWRVAHHAGGSQPLQEHVAHVNGVRASRGAGGFSVELGPMPDENTYGLYTSGVRQIVLREGMPFNMFMAVLDHEAAHGTDDMQDQRDKGGTKIGHNAFRDAGDNIFRGPNAQGISSSPQPAGQQAAATTAETASAQPGTAAQPGASSSEQESAQLDSEEAETFAWHLMACAAGVPAIIPDVQKCD